MDMLIKLYALPDAAGAAPATGLAPPRKPIGTEHIVIGSWVAQRFGPGWASEVQVALANRPVTVFIATDQTRLLGFACYDATARGFFGPIGVAESARRHGLGAALLLACLHDMRSAGYGYAIVGGVGSPGFFQRVAAAVEIEGSTPGLYPARFDP